MTQGLEQLIQGGVTLIVIIVFAIISSIILFLLKKYEIKLKNLFGNTPIMNEVIDSVVIMIKETVVEVAKTVSEKYRDDGIITKEELEAIKLEAIEIINKKLTKSQSDIIRAIHDDVMAWIASQVTDVLTTMVTEEKSQKPSS